MSTPLLAEHGGDFVPPSLPTIRKRPSRAPLDEREQLIFEVLTQLMHLDDSHTLGRDTLEMIQVLPWEQIRLLRDQLTGTSGS